MGLFQKREMVMVVGLGNPGKEYEGTRHNVGFRTISLLAEKLGVKIDRLRFQALTREVTYHDRKLLLVEPQTYMNLSGAAVGATVGATVGCAVWEARAMCARGIKA